MSPTPVSVIVVSKGRPNALKRCLTGISQVNYHPFEVIVVTDQVGIQSINSLGFGEKISAIEFEQANVAKARNIGLAKASGDIVAFIDDDSVPEPSWLRYLSQPFADADVQFAGGYVKGRNGISFQWKGRLVNALGYETPISVEGEAAIIVEPPEGQALKTQGTNCAFRRDALCRIGGFDEVFSFGYDDTDVCFRLAQQQAKSAIVPMAHVHHGYMSSPRRHANRAPKSLFALGASTAAFVRKHAAADRHAERFQDLISEQRKNLIRHMHIGAIEPAQVGQLMQSLLEGIEAGKRLEIGQVSSKLGDVPEFKVFSDEMTFLKHKHIVSRLWSRKNSRTQAKRLVENGSVVTIFEFDRTTKFHHVTFDPDGYWVQSGGVYGKSVRSGKLVQPNTFGRRVRAELESIRKFRDPNVYFPNGDEASEMN